MVMQLKDGKKMIPLKSGNMLLIGLGEGEATVFVCNTGGTLGETNDTIVLSPEEVEDVIGALIAEKRKTLAIAAG